MRKATAVFVFVLLLAAGAGVVCFAPPRTFDGREMYEKQKDRIELAGFRSEAFVVRGETRPPLNSDEAADREVARAVLKKLHGMLQEAESICRRAEEVIASGTSSLDDIRKATQEVDNLLNSATKELVAFTPEKMSNQRAYKNLFDVCRDVFQVFHREVYVYMGFDYFITQVERGEQEAHPYSSETKKDWNFFMIQSTINIRDRMRKAEEHARKAKELLGLE